MGGNYFDVIAQELLKQQHLMERLIKENQELRRQLTHLREGKGISIEIFGQRFATMGEISSITPASVSLQHGTTPPSIIASAIVEAPITAMATPTPQQKEMEGTAPPEEKRENNPPPFLEEIIIDEFATAMTNPMAAMPAKKEQRTEQEQQALLRQELMGSYLLE